MFREILTKVLSLSAFEEVYIRLKCLPSSPEAQARKRFVADCLEIAKTNPDLSACAMTIAFCVATTYRLWPLDQKRKIACQIQRKMVVDVEAFLGLFPYISFKWSLIGIRVIYTDGGFSCELMPFSYYDRSFIRRSIPKAIRERVLSVGYCLACKSNEKLSVDHIWPVSKGGTNDELNLQCLCMPCNLRKRANFVPAYGIANP